MKCLRISNGKGEFSLDGSNFSELDVITKEDILALLNIALDDGGELEMDEYDTDLISNAAHKIIYSNLHEKLQDLIANKQQFVDDVSDLYKDAYEQYHKEEAEIERAATKD